MMATKSTKPKKSMVMVKGKLVAVNETKSESKKWKERTKKAGRTTTPVAKALSKASEALSAAAEVKSIVEAMGDKQRKLYSALTMGKKSYEAIYDAGLEEQYLWPHMRKVVMNDGEVMQLQDLTKRDLKKVHHESLRRMEEVADHALDIHSRHYDIKTYIHDIKDAFSVVAPDAFRIINEVMTNEHESGKVRAEIAFKVLDRAGYNVKEESGSKQMPAQVNIMITDNPQGTVEVIGGSDE